MTVAQKDKVKARFDELKATGRLPSPNPVVLAILSLSRRENVSAAELARMLQTDPALTGKILKYANSAAECARRPIITVSEAVIKIGINAVSSIALSFSLVSRYRSGICRAFDYDEFWAQSVMAACASQEIAKYVKSVAAPEEMFTCGLLSRVGELAMATLFPEEYGALVAAGYPREMMAEAERERFSVDHNEITAVLLSDWGLPPAFAKGAELRESLSADAPTGGERWHRVALLLDVAYKLAMACRSGEVPRTPLLPELLAAADRLGISSDQLHSIAESMIQHWHAVCDLLGIDRKTTLAPAYMAAKQHHNQAGPTLQASSAAETMPADGVRVLLVNPSETVLSATKRAFEGSGNVIMTVRSHSEASLQLVELVPHVIILGGVTKDFNLHILDIARSSRELKHVHILAITDGSKEAAKAALDAGADDFIRLPIAADELDARLRAAYRIVSLQLEIERERDENRRYVGELAVSNRKLEEVTLTDALTGMPNRLLFQDRLRQALAHAERSGKKVAVLIVDLNRFKNINDSLGHEIGDTLLRAISGRFQGCLRDGDTLSRMGGDEFSFILPNIHKAADVAHVCKRLIKSLEKPVTVGGIDLSVSASIGASLYPHDGNDWLSLIKNAESAMYEAKKAGENVYHFYTEEINAALVGKMRIEAAIRRGLEAGNFHLAYQPQIDLVTGRIYGVEALIRWNDPELGVVPPSQFIPVAEESGLIVPLGEWVMRNAAHQAKAWHDAGYRDIKMSVNLSAKQFRQQNIAQEIAQVLKETALPPHLLEVEITETAVIENIGHTANTLETLKAIGVSISLDDFGTGYSSLAYLKRLPIHVLKIDRSFVSGLPRDPDDAQIVRFIVELSAGLGINLIAEGVETPEQLDFLCGLGCGYGQGYFFSKPVSAKEIELKFLRGGYHFAVGAESARLSGAMLPSA